MNSSLHLRWVFLFFGFILEFNNIILFMVGNVPIDSKTSVLIRSTSSVFGGVRRDRIYVHIFIRMSILVNICACTVTHKKHRWYRTIFGLCNFHDAHASKEHIYNSMSSILIRLIVGLYTVAIHLLMSTDREFISRTRQYTITLLSPIYHVVVVLVKLIKTLILRGVKRQTNREKVW